MTNARAVHARERYRRETQMHTRVDKTYPQKKRDGKVSHRQPPGGT